MGGKLRTVSLQPKAGAWTLDLDALLAAITPSTRLLIVNAPNNPTGWTLTTEEQREFARRVAALRRGDDAQPA